MMLLPDAQNRILAFIVGLARAGRTWFSRSLNEHPEVSLIGETAYWGRRYPTPLDGKYLTVAQVLAAIDDLNESGPKFVFYQATEVESSKFRDRLRALIGTKCDFAPKTYIPATLFRFLSLYSRTYLDALCG